MNNPTSIPCAQCDGKGWQQPAMDLLLRPPKEQREYEEDVRNMRLPCYKCNGTGRC